MVPWEEESGAGLLGCVRTVPKSQSVVLLFVLLTRFVPFRFVLVLLGFGTTEGACIVAKVPSGGETASIGLVDT